MYEHSPLFSVHEVQNVHTLLLELIQQPSKSSLVTILRETYLSTNDAVILHDIDPYYITITVPDHQIPIYIYPHSLTLSLFTPPQTLRSVFTCKKLDIDHEFIESVLSNEWDMTEYQREFKELEREKRIEETKEDKQEDDEKKMSRTSSMSSVCMSHSDSTATVVTVNETPLRSLLRTVSARTIQTAPPRLTRSCSMSSSASLASSRTRKPTWK